MPIKLGLALGGGGAKGLAHIPLLEVLDDLGVVPDRIAGTSIGAVIGALRASGLTGRQIRELVRQTAVRPSRQTLREAWKKKQAPPWVRFFDVDFSRKALFRGDRFIEFLYEAMGAASFEELHIPLKIVATDFWSGDAVILQSGPLLPAVKASMGLPGVFTPVTLNGRVLIDGGGCNPVPYDLLQGECDTVVAVDVLGDPGPAKRTVPGPFTSVLRMFDVMQNSIVREKLKRQPPDVYLRPELAGIHLLDFLKADRIFQQAKPAAARLRKALAAL